MDMIKGMLKFLESQQKILMKKLLMITGILILVLFSKNII